jgi:hypothetical protein
MIKDSANQDVRGPPPAPGRTIQSPGFVLLYFNARYTVTPCAGDCQFRVASRKGVTNTHRTEKRCRLLAVEILGDRRDMSNIRNLIALNNVTVR